MGNGPERWHIVKCGGAAPGSSLQIILKTATWKLTRVSTCIQECRQALAGFALQSLTDEHLLSLRSTLQPAVI